MGGAMRVGRGKWKRVVGWVVQAGGANDRAMCAAHLSALNSSFFALRRESHCGCESRKDQREDLFMDDA